MASPSALAGEHQARLIAINKTATGRALSIWRRMDFDALDASWLTIAPALLQQTDAAQLAAAKTSDRYVSALSAAYEFDQDVARTIPQSFVGVDGSGRPMESLLHGAVTTTKGAVGAGLGRVESMQAGAAFLAAMVKTGLADLGRASDLTAATGKGYTHYVRVVNPGACSRCAILAGIDSFSRAFKRHPACKCTTAPVVMDGTITPPGLHSSPDDYFESLPTAEQDRIFTKGGAEAIRSGARAQDVVSARRGASGITTSRGVGRQTVPNSGRRIAPTRIGSNADGSPIMGYTTSEGSIRGAFKGRSRLMPETIVGLTDDMPTRQLLLRDAGYLTRPVANLSDNSWVQKEAAAKIADRSAAQEFYRSVGITRG